MCERAHWQLLAEHCPSSSLNARKASLCARHGLTTSNETAEAITIAKIVTSAISSFRDLVSRTWLS